MSQNMIYNNANKFKQWNGRGYRRYKMIKPARYHTTRKEMRRIKELKVHRNNMLKAYPYPEDNDFDTARDQYFVPSANWFWYNNYIRFVPDAEYPNLKDWITECIWKNAYMVHGKLVSIFQENNIPICDDIIKNEIIDFIPMPPLPSIRVLSPVDNGDYYDEIDYTQDDYDDYDDYDSDDSYGASAYDDDRYDRYECGRLCPGCRSCRDRRYNSD